MPPATMPEAPKMVTSSAALPKGLTRAQIPDRTHQSRFLPFTPSAIVDGVEGPDGPPLYKVAYECSCGTLTYTATTPPPDGFGHSAGREPCPRCRWAQLFARIQEQHGLVNFLDLDPARSEYRELQARFPMLASQVTAPADHRWPGPLGPSLDLVWLPRRGVPATASRITALVDRFAAGDFGEHGLAVNLEPSPLATWCPSLADGWPERNALALGSGEGLCVGRYSVPSQGGGEIALDVVAFFSAGRAQVLAGLPVTPGRETV